MSFGKGFEHADSFDMLEDGTYTAKIVKAEIKSGNYGDYIQAEVVVEGHPNANPHIFLLNDAPKAGFGSFTLEQAMHMWNQTMTKVFANFGIPEGDFDMTHWVGHVGTVTVRPQKKKPEYKELVPYVVTAKKEQPKKAVETHTSTDNAEGFPEDMPDIF